MSYLVLLSRSGFFFSCWFPNHMEQKINEQNWNNNKKYTHRKKYADGAFHLHSLNIFRCVQWRGNSILFFLFAIFLFSSIWFVWCLCVSTVISHLIFCQLMMMLRKWSRKPHTRLGIDIPRVPKVWIPLRWNRDDLNRLFNKTNDLDQHLKIARWRELSYSSIERFLERNYL